VLVAARKEAQVWLASCGTERVPAPGEIRLARLRPPEQGLTNASPVEIEALLVGTLDGKWIEVHLPGNPILVGTLCEKEWKGGRTFTGARSPLEEECLRVAQRAPTSRGAALALGQLAEGGWVSLVDQMDPLDSENPSLREELRIALEQGERLAGLFEPTRILLRGPTNAGKSTLFNLLLGVERVRTGPEAGLTLDPVSESIEGLGWPFLLVDTAGEREVEDGVEREAMLLGQSLESFALPVEVHSQACKETFPSKSLNPLDSWRDPEKICKKPRRGLRPIVFFTHAEAGKGEGQTPEKGQQLRFDLLKDDPDRVRGAFFRKICDVLGREPFPPIEGRSCLLTSRQKELVKQILSAQSEDLRQSCLTQLKRGIS